jgi:hypothetical protein
MEPPSLGKCLMFVILLLLLVRMLQDIEDMMTSKAMLNKVLHDFKEQKRYWYQI